VKKQRNKPRRKVTGAKAPSRDSNKPSSEPLPARSLVQVIRTHPTWMRMSRLAAFIGLLIGIFLTSSKLLGGLPWPVDPDVHFRDTNDGSSLIMPFDIVNKSGFYMPSVEFRCGIEFVQAFDSVDHEIVLGHTAFLNGKKTIQTTATIDCNAADLLGIGPDGSLALRNSSTILENRARIVYRAPWRIIKMCVWVEGHYRFMGIIPVEFTSHVFQWPAKTGAHQWRESPFIGDRPLDEIEEETRLGLIPGVMGCPDAKRFPYIYVVGQGRASLIGPGDVMGRLGEIPLPPTL
jgi:hypothetical protein